MTGSLGSSGWGPVSKKEWRNLPGRIVTKSLWACETGSWSLISYPRGADGKADLSGEPEFREFLCGSWRCRRCGEKVRASDFVRVACASKVRPDWFYMVLTVDPAEWGDRWEAFGGIYKLWQDRLRKKLERFARANGGEGRLEYIMTFERHTSSGWPHVNILMAHEGLRAASAVYGTEIRRKGRARDGRKCFKPNWRPLLVDMVKTSGFGNIVWLEDVQDPEAWAGYITKLAHELVGSEVKSQTPYGAPKNFRRLRATRGTLPPTFASVKDQSGYRGPRVWAMTSKSSLESWTGLPEPAMLKSAKVVFDRNSKEKPGKLIWAPAFKLMKTMESALKRTDTDWPALVAGWQEMEEVKAWNKERSESAKAEATLKRVGA